MTKRLGKYMLLGSLCLAAACLVAPRPARAAPPVLKLTLVEVIERALSANRNLAGARDQVTSTRFSMASAKSEFELVISPGGQAGYSGGTSGDYDPTLGMGVNLRKKFETGTIITVSPTLSRGTNYGSQVAATVVQPLLRGFGRDYNLNGVRQAQFSHRTALRSLFLRRSSTVLSAVTALYEVIRQRELVRLNRESVNRLSANVAAAKAKEKQSLGSPIDAFRAGIQLQQAREALVSALESYENAWDRLKFILAYPLSLKMDVKAPLTYSLVKLGEKDAIRLALTNRLELKQARDSLRESSRVARISKKNILPGLSLVLSYTRSGAGEDTSGFSDMSNGFWGVSLSLPADYSMKARSFAYQQSLINVEASRRNLSVQRDEIVTQVKAVIRDLRRAAKRIDLLKSQIHQATGQLALARTRYKWGKASNFDLIEAETQLRQSQTNLISGVISYIVGTYRLRSALGTLLEAPKVR